MPLKKKMKKKKEKETKEKKKEEKMKKVCFTTIPGILEGSQLFVILLLTVTTLAPPTFTPLQEGHFSRLRHLEYLLCSWADENLGQTGLSDTAEILDELFREGYLSLTDLELSNPQTANRSSRLDQAQSSWMSQKRVLPEDERRELRVWMRRKQRERLAVYQKHREHLREREHKPFSTSGKVVRYVHRLTRNYIPLYVSKHISNISTLFVCTPLEIKKK
ncbi:putative protein C5orf42 [Liparis tanakae]|uniref:Uncharacterized protein n=1 Tax=Liparis tanakae TaxID=230148 RepID=A0A4Z2ITT3_9TELE|nr:putative protein C5orf42 [Liparis tanakae]